MTIDELYEAVNEMKAGKAPGLNGGTVECSKRGGVVNENLMCVW